MQMIRWMCGISLKDRRTNEVLRRLVEVDPITAFTRSGRLRWYGHVMRKRDEYWVNKCMEYRVECRRPVGRPRRTLLKSVEADMTALEINKEDYVCSDTYICQLDYHGLTAVSTLHHPICC